MARACNQTIWFGVLVLVAFVVFQAEAKPKVHFGSHIKAAGLLQLKDVGSASLKEGLSLNLINERKASKNKIQTVAQQELSVDALFVDEDEESPAEEFRFTACLSLLALSGLCFAKNKKSLALAILLLAISTLFLEINAAEEKTKKSKGKGGKGKGGKGGKGGSGGGKAVNCSNKKNKKLPVCKNLPPEASGLGNNFVVTANGDGSYTIAVSPKAPCAASKTCDLTFSAIGTSSNPVTLENQYGSISTDPTIPVSFTTPSTYTVISPVSVTLHNLNPTPGVAFSLTVESPIIYLQFAYGQFVGNFDLNCFAATGNPACLSTILGTTQHVSSTSTTSKSGITTKTIGDTAFSGTSVHTLAATGSQVTVDFGTAPTNSPSTTAAASISATATVTVTPTISETSSVTPTISVTSSVTPTISDSASVTPTISVSASVTPTISVSSTISITPSMTPTISVSATVTPTATQTVTPTASLSPTISITSSVTATPTISITPSVTVTPTSSVTPTISITSSVTATPTISITPSVTITPTSSATPTISVTSSVTATPTISITPSVTVTPTGSATPTISVTSSVTPSVTASITPSSSVTPTISITSSLTPSATISITPSITPTQTVSNSITPTISITSSSTPTQTVSISITPTQTVSNSITPTQTVSDSITPTQTISNSMTPTISITTSATGTTTASVTATPTISVSTTISVTSSISATPTISQTATASVTSTISLTPTLTPTMSPTISLTSTPTISITPSNTPSQSFTPSFTPTISVTASPIIPCPYINFVPTQNNTDFNNNYPLWKAKYVTSSGAPVGYRVVDFSDCSEPSRTISEGIAYGMILSAFAQDSSVFAGLWKYAQYFFNANGCMAYLINPNGQVLDKNCAPDADEDMVYALMIASVEFSNATYYTNAIQLANSIYTTSVDSSTNILLPFPPFTTPTTAILNPSYFAPGYYDMFMGRDTIGNRWDLVQSASYSVLSSISSSQGLVQDWCNSTGGTVDYTYGPTTACVVSSTNARCAQWPYRIQPDPFNSVNTKMSFFFSAVTVSGQPDSVQVDCGDGSGFQTATQTTVITPMWTLPSIPSSCQSSVTLKVTKGAETYIYYTFYWIGSYCLSVQDSFNGYYGFDAVRMPWRTAFDAVYLGNSNSISRCETLMSTVFASSNTIDGQKFLDGTSVTSTYTGALFRSPAVVCASIISNSAQRTALYDNLSGPLTTGQYYPDTIQLLMQLFVTGKMTNTTCGLLQAPITPQTVTTSVYGAGLTATAPSAASVCYRSASNLNYVSWTVGVEFDEPVLYHDVSIDCGNGYQSALQPNPDPFNTFYLTSACLSSNYSVQFTPKSGFNGALSNYGVTSQCKTTTFPSFCWTSSTVDQYYLQLQAFTTPTELQIDCADYSTAIASRGLRTLNTTINNYPYLYSTNDVGTPTVKCSESGQTLLVSTDASGGQYGYLTNWRTDVGVASEFCPVVSAPAVPTGTRDQYCWKPASNTYSVQLRVNATYITSAQVDCGSGGVITGSYSNQAFTFAPGSGPGCDASGSISVSFNGGAFFASNWLNTSLCQSACYVSTSSQYYVGVVFELQTLNATISQPSSICRYPGPLTMDLTSQYSAGTFDDKKGLDYCLVETPQNTTITYYQSTSGAPLTLTGDFRDPALQCII